MSTPPPSAQHHPRAAVIVVARHGERMDYVCRDSVDQPSNWVADHRDRQPWNPPLTDHGKEQATQLGHQVKTRLTQLGLPAVSAVYSSPLLRCLQTAASTGLGERVCMEEGLVESINMQWYRSWALDGSDGTWGGGPKEYEESSVHEDARRPIQELLQDIGSSGTAEPLPSRVDATYQSKSRLSTPYKFPDTLESRVDQRKRMKNTVELLSRADQTVLLVSHGGPVTHLYEELTDKSWHEHGESSYCCYSIYLKEEGCRTWKPVEVNQSDYLNEAHLHKDAYVTDNSA